MVACCAVTNFTKAEPTLPHPSTPIRTSFVTARRLRGGLSPQKPFEAGQLDLRRAINDATEPVPTRIAAIRTPPIPAPVLGRLAGVVVAVAVPFVCGASDARCWVATGTTGASAADATHAWCCTPESSVTIDRAPSAHAGESHETVALAP